ncbi:hypothetical protein SKC41_14070 [Mycobacterium sp. 050128]|uniref:hypothetical protein n=1 Tax=Mycobacterium sp. 050128 TaxID=3096112 RepID=UPI002ED775A9
MASAGVPANATPGAPVLLDKFRSDLPTGPDDPRCLQYPGFAACQGGPYWVGPPAPSPPPGPPTGPLDPQCAMNPADAACMGSPFLPPSPAAPPPLPPVVAPPAEPIAPPPIAPPPRMEPIAPPPEISGHI